MSHGVLCPSTFLVFTAKFNFRPNTACTCCMPALSYVRYMYPVQSKGAVAQSALVYLFFKKHASCLVGGDVGYAAWVNPGPSGSCKEVRGKGNSTAPAGLDGWTGARPKC